MGVNSALEIIVNARLQIINKVATTAVALVIKPPADLDNIKFSWETPIPNAPPSDFCNKISKTKITAVILVLLILLQKSEGGALGIGVSQENFMLSRSAGGFMTKATAVVATLFIICSLALTIISRAELTPTSSVLDTVEEKTEDTPSIPENN